MGTEAYEKGNDGSRRRPSKSSTTGACGKGTSPRRPSKANEMSVDALRSYFAAKNDPSQLPHAIPGENRNAETQEKRSDAAPKKLLVANRGEIAIRVCRTAHELGIRTVAIFSYEDRLSMHRYKADEAYQIGHPGQFSPVAAYLAIDEIVKIANQTGATFVHPGYGFLSENAEFARHVEAAGLKFVGPTSEVIELLGDKTSARKIAMEVNVPVVPGSPGPILKAEEGIAFVKEHGFPVIIKAAKGGGGRGMRVVRNMDNFLDSFRGAQSEALSAFGDGTVFLERFLDRPKHIEVQLLGDSEGNVVHFWERDCSVQRRHQKVVEVAPSVAFDPKLRMAILEDALKIARYVKYRNAGTAEFLVDNQGRHYFIEINPRIQVEHTITEEVTGIDLVAAQIEIAAGKSLASLGLEQSSIAPRGYAIQCRVTTEDPSANFRPDTGRIDVYRSAGGNGIRLDGGAGYSGAVITPFYDSLLVKVTARGHTFDMTRRKILRALIEFRIRGVKTNIPFLQRLMVDPTFASGGCWTTFLDDTPDLFRLVASKNRAQKLLQYLAEMVVNGSSVKGQQGPPGLTIPLAIPSLPFGADVSQGLSADKGWRGILLRDGPEAFARAVRQYKGTLITDTTWRDAHQSLLATRVRTYDIAAIACSTSHAFAQAFSLEMWGGATFDVALRFLYEDPWERLDKLRALVPNIPFQMLLRGTNAVGYTSYPDNVIYDFCAKAHRHGIDVFRVFDSLNYVENMRLGIDAAKQAGGVVEAAICYSGDIADPSRKKYNVQYYVDLVTDLVKEGIHILGIKDMAGLLKPKAAGMLVAAIRERFPDLPIHVHTHDTAATGVASMIAAAEAGADVVDVAVDSMSGLTSQPCMGAVCAALDQTGLPSGISLEAVTAINEYWEQVRLMYSCFDPGLRSGDSSVYEHEMPGGQYTNLQFQAHSLGLGSRWHEVKKAYAAANRLCGDIIKVTPSSKVVGDLAQFMVSNKLSEEDIRRQARSLSFPTSVIEFFQGYLGQPYGGFPEPLRSDIIKNLPRIDGRPGATMPHMDLEALRAELEDQWGKEVIRDVDVSSAALYPEVFDEYMEKVEKYGSLSVLPTSLFLAPLRVCEEEQVEIEPGKTLIIKLLAVGPADKGSGRRDVYFELNGDGRTVSVEDASTGIVVEKREQANKADVGELGAPMSGLVVEVRVTEGAKVAAGDPICSLAAMKMETIVTAQVSGTVERVAVREGDTLTAGDLIAKIRPKGE